ncbi:MAG TPA: hypothetical protein VFX16_27100 [Pseudonocardiaceae bacterium]|nr:hypothetical protein [Pseudonocardiaceae bacterium]
MARVGHPDAFAAAIAALVELFRDTGVTAVAGIESRGFLLGGAAAVDLDVGFVVVRKAGALFPGPKIRRRTEPDYRGNRTDLLLRQDSVGRGDRVLLVDD